eukprot:jgi/Mesvir1/2084/Mv16617-RA.1
MPAPRTRHGMSSVFIHVITYPTYILWTLAALITVARCGQTQDVCDRSVAGLNEGTACIFRDVHDLNAGVCSKSRQEARRLDPSGEIVSHDEPIRAKTDPAFTIHVHPPSYDSERALWGIVDTGLYHDAMLTLAAKTYLHNKPRSIVVDVGSNIGWLSLYAAAMGHEVFSFEPNSFNVVRQCQSLSANTFAAPYHIIDMAVGHEEASGLTMTWAVNPVTATLVPAENMPGQEPREMASNNVTVTSMDAFFAREEAARGHPLPISFLKIDVEGFEPMVIKGALGILQRRLVQVIYMEVSVLVLSPVSWRACIEALIKLGYRLVSVSYGTEARQPDFVAQFNKDHDIGLLLFKCASKAYRQCDLLWELKSGV